MKKYKIDEKGRIRLSSKILNFFSNRSILKYDFDLINSAFIISTNNSLPHQH